MIGWRSRKGQAVFSEYIMVLFIVIAALSAISIYVRRGLQARIHDTRNYMINTVNSACDANCQNATGNVAYEYEPYYTQTSASTMQKSTKADLGTKGATKEGVYQQLVNESTSTNYNATQLPAECVGPNGPPCCYKIPPDC